MSSTWEKLTDPESNKSYYYNATTGTTSWDKPTTTVISSSSGLSALSKQLRELQSTNTIQSLENDKLNRQIAIAAEIKGTSVAAIKAALKQACEGEAHAELIRECSSLRSKLQNASSNKQQTAVDFSEVQAQKNAAMLELKIGELQEVEQDLQIDLSNLYKRTGDLETTVASLRAELEIKNMSVQQLQQELSNTSTTTDTETSVASQQLQEHITTLETELVSLRSSKAKNKVLDEQLLNVKHNFQLKQEQHEARFQVQDLRIKDMEGQLSSLYTAFEILQHENNEMLTHSKNMLHASDSQIALQLHESLVAEEKEEQDQRISKSLATASPPPPPSSPLPSSSSSILIQGFLHKRPKSLGKKKTYLPGAWKKRWFELLSNGTLIYREKPGSKIKGAIGPITALSFLRQVNDFSQKPFTFELQINKNDKNNMVLYASVVNELDFDNWFNQLINLINQNRIPNTPNKKTAVDSNVRAVRSMTSHAVLSTPVTETKKDDQEASDHAMAMRLAREFESE